MPRPGIEPTICRLRVQDPTTTPPSHPEKLPTCYGLVSDTANESATSRCNGIWETTRHNRHNGLLPVPNCYGLAIYVADSLWTCYAETGVMDFGLYRIYVSCSLIIKFMTAALTRSSYIETFQFSAGGQRTVRVSVMSS